MRPIWRTIPRAGALDSASIRNIALVCGADALLAISFGAVAVAGGLPVWFPVAMSVLVFAGGAQFAALSALLAGGGAIPAITAGLVLNARLLPYGFSVADLIGGAWWRRLIGAQIITDESVAFALQEQGRARRAAFWVCGIALYLSWNAATGLGALAGTMIKDTQRLGLDAVFPAVMVALVLPALRDREARTPAIVGAVIALAATPFLPAGAPMLLALAGLALARIRLPARLRVRVQGQR